jgi:hypothetical protein
MIEEVRFNNELIALIIRSNYSKEGISFFTPNDFSQQLAYMEHGKGKVIQPHVHNPVKREIHYTKEVLVIRKGKLRVDLYDDCQNYLESHVLNQGDVILLSTGGHGFLVLEDLEMFEVKQGPYAGDTDKTRFVGIEDAKIILK